MIQQLIDYIKKAREAGKTDEEIRRLLYQNEWTEAEVDDAMLSLDHPEIEIAPSSIPQPDPELEEDAFNQSPLSQNNFNEDNNYNKYNQYNNLKLMSKIILTIVILVLLVGSFVGGLVMKTQLDKIIAQNTSDPTNNVTLRIDGEINKIEGNKLTILTAGIGNALTLVPVVIRGDVEILNASPTADASKKITPADLTVGQAVALLVNRTSEKTFESSFIIITE